MYFKNFNVLIFVITIEIIIIKHKIKNNKKHGNFLSM
jgi:hypothetical protein